MKVSILNEKNDREKINQNHNTVVTNLSSHVLPKGSFKKYVGSKLPVFDPPPPPLFVPIRFTCTPSLPLTFVRFSELPPSQIKFRDIYDAYFE